MADSSQVALIWGLAAATSVATCIAVLFFVRQRRTTENHHAALASQDEQIAALQQKVAAAEQEIQEITDGKISAVLKSAMQALRVLLAEQQVELDQLQREYGGHPVLQQLLTVNHANAQVARRAQGIAVLCGGFSGRRREPATLYDVARSAQGQIAPFERIQIRNQSAMAVMPQAIDGVALAMAELLANAASYSPAETPIEVNLQPVQRGVCIIIDDAGVGMSEETRQKAERLFSSVFRPGLSELGNPPQFGFPVVAELARRFGFAVDVSATSPYGGTRAVLRLPQELLTTATEKRSGKVVANPSSTPSPEPSSDPADRTANGLPKRASRQAPIALVRDPSAAPEAAEPAKPVRKIAATMSELQRGTRLGRQPSKDDQEDQGA